MEAWIDTKELCDRNVTLWESSYIVKSEALDSILYTAQNKNSEKH
jgi:hypothetical protein